MVRPVSLLEIDQDIYTILFDYKNQIVQYDITEDKYYLKLTVDVGGWVWENTIEPSTVEPQFNNLLVLAKPIARKIQITLRSNEWLVSRCLEERASRIQNSYKTDNHLYQVLIDYITPEFSDLTNGYTIRKGFIDPGSFRGIAGNYQTHREDSSGLLSTEESNRVQFTFSELVTRNN
jgi:hypothetical protein